MTLVVGVLTVLILYKGGREVVDGQLTLGEFVQFMAYVAMLGWPMIALGWVGSMWQQGTASLWRMHEVLSTPPRIASPPEPQAWPARGAIEFRDVSLVIDGRTILDDVNLTIPAGATYAIVGPLGAGKTSLVSLIPRLHDVTSGQVLVDGVDVRDLPLEELRRRIGFVPQETFLFSDTVGGNVAFGVPTDGKERVEWAATVSQLAKDVSDFPKGYDTVVGERGITLSGGQKQRTALARALAVEPRILVLDDALASVDTETEEQILGGLRDVRAGRTTFLVSHRVSTVKDADLIVVLRDGRIVERGSHDELLASGGFYAELHRRQLLEQEVETA